MNKISTGPYVDAVAAYESFIDTGELVSSGPVACYQIPDLDKLYDEISSTLLVEDSPATGKLAPPTMSLSDMSTLYDEETYPHLSRLVSEVAISEAARQVRLQTLRCLSE